MKFNILPEKFAYQALVLSCLIVQANGQAITEPMSDQEKRQDTMPVSSHTLSGPKFDIVEYGSGVLSAAINLIPRSLDIVFLVTGNQNRVENDIENVIFHGKPFLTSVEPRRLETWETRLTTAYNYWRSSPGETLKRIPEALSPMGTVLVSTCNPFAKGISEKERGSRTFNLAVILPGVTSTLSLGTVIDRITSDVTRGGAKFVMARTPEGISMPVLVASGGESGVAVAAATIPPKSAVGFCLMASKNTLGSGRKIPTRSELEEFVRQARENPSDVPEVAEKFEAYSRQPNQAARVDFRMFHAVYGPWTEIKGFVEKIVQAHQKAGKVAKKSLESLSVDDLANVRLTADERLSLVNMYKDEVANIMIQEGAIIKRYGRIAKRWQPSAETAAMSVLDQEEPVGEALIRLISDPKALADKTFAKDLIELLWDPLP